MSNVRRSDRRSAEALRMAMVPSQLSALILFAIILTGSVGKLRAADDVKPEPPVGQVREEQTALSKYADMPLPKAADLLRARPFDWVVLKTQDVLVVDPLPMRPDPIARVTVKHETAQQAYNRVLKNRPYKETELASLRQFFKNNDRVDEFDATEARLKEDLEKSRERADSLRPQTYKIPVTLRDGSVDPEYVVDLRFVDFVVHFEDLVLRRATQLITEGRVALAYDLLVLVARRQRENNLIIQNELESEERELLGRIKNLEAERGSLRASKEELNALAGRNSPGAKGRLSTLDKTVAKISAEIKEIEEELRGVRFKLRFARPKDFPKPEPVRKDDLLLPSWPKFDETYQKLVFKDADLHVERGQPEQAFRLLEELTGEIPGLSTRLGRTADLLIAPCVDRQDFRQARFFLSRLATRDPSNSVVQKWRDDLAARTSTVMQEALAAATRGEAALAAKTIDRAARIWPETAGLKETHRDLNDRHQVLRVGVLRLANELVREGTHSEANERARLLTEVKLFEPAGVSAKGVRYRSSYFESWEPTDLGRRVLFRMRLKRADWESRALITSADVFAEMTSRIDPDSPRFDERLAGFVDGITVYSPAEFSVNLRQLPLRPEAIWQLTVPASDSTRSLNDDVTVGDRLLFGRQRFSATESDNGRSVYGRVRTQPASIRQRRVDEVVEVRYDSWERALQGLLRGDVSVLPTTEFKDLKSLQEDGRFFVIPYAIPRTHFLLFNPRNAALQDGQLRRALLHGVPRDRLRKGLVEDAADSLVRLVTCPFASNSYGYNRQLPQLDYDPPLAATLALTAKKQLGGTLPTLRMICPDDARLRGLSLAMIEEWRRVGITVRLLNEGEAGDWDICYRTARCVEPLTEIWPLLTLQSSARIDALQSLSEPTRRGLLELERSGDWTTAIKLLHRLLGELLIEARYIPLWEVDEFLIARKHISGIPERPIHSYDDIERWSVQSWYPAE